MIQPETARVERGPITENVRFKPLSEEEINNLWEGVYFALGMAALLERQGFTVAAAEMRRLHAENRALTDALFQAQEAAKALLAQRDALLAACRMAMMLRHLGGMLPGSREIVEEIVKAASAAIAKAEEKT